MCDPNRVCADLVRLGAVCPKRPNMIQRDDGNSFAKALRQERNHEVVTPTFCDHALRVGFDRDPLTAKPLRASDGTLFKLKVCTRRSLMSYLAVRT